MSGGVYIQAAAFARLVRGERGLTAGHPLAGTPCPACSDPLLVGQPLGLLALGPGDDPEDQRKWAEGLVIDAPAVALHAACAGLRPLDAEREPTRCSICNRRVPECECCPGGPLVAIEGDKVLSLEDVLGRLVSGREP